MDIVFSSYIHFDPQRQMFFVDLILISILCPSIVNPNFSRTIHQWTNSVIAGNGTTLNDVYLTKGIASCGRGAPSRHGMLRRDYFDMLMMSPIGPKPLQLTWTPERIRYVHFAYPNVPIPGVSRGFTCQSEQQRARVMAAFAG